MYTKIRWSVLLALSRQTNDSYKLGSRYHLRIRQRLLKGIMRTLSWEVFPGILSCWKIGGRHSDIPYLRKRTSKPNMVKLNNFSLEIKLLWGEVKHTLLLAWLCQQYPLSVVRSITIRNCFHIKCQVYYCSCTISLLTMEDPELIKQISLIHCSIIGLLFTRAYHV